MPSGDWWFYFKHVSGFFDQTRYLLSIRLVQTTRSCKSVFAATALADRCFTKVSENPAVTLYIACSTAAYANGVLNITHQEFHNVNPHLTGLTLDRIKDG
jgi:hypothetical protein